MADPYVESLVRDLERVGRGPLPSPAQMTQAFSGMTGIGGLFDMVGMMPEMPDRKTTMLEMMREGERSPSLLQNLREENYLDAGLQLAGTIPFVGAPVKMVSRLQRAKEVLGDPQKYTPEEYKTRLRYQLGQFYDEDQKNLAADAVKRIAEQGEDKSLTTMGITSADSLRPDASPPSVAFSDLVKGGTFQKLSGPVDDDTIGKLFDNVKAERLLKQNLISDEEFEAIKYQRDTRTTRFRKQQEALDEELGEAPTGIETLDPSKKMRTEEEERKKAVTSQYLRQLGMPVDSFKDPIEPNVQKQVDDILDRPDPEG